ncbi:protein valois isoform X2 [Anoplophora glabripennis]|uniref:protein valois isoform X2 n=1 Tax=Anoplophora glabripennis TaxID=217634 RepID=UPI000873DF33|nr:protein valois isoform X2 [Anoplophora glabripennis]
MSNSYNNKEGLGVDGVIFPPNKPLEPRIEFSKTPVIYDFLFFLDFNENGNCIVGASEVAGTFWEGTLLYFKDKNCMENFDYCGHYIYATTSDGKFIALAEDTGNINILSLDLDSTIRPINYFKMIERIPQLSVWNNSCKILSCSERSIMIWDIDSIDRKPCKNFDNYHTDRVTSIDTLKKDTNLFLSGGRDRISCLWDLRSPTTPSVIYTNEFSSICSVSWNQDNDNYIVVGTQAGDVYLLDKREPKDFVSVLHCFDGTINRISFKNSSEFAVCGDVNEVLIVNSNKNSLEILYRNTEHIGPVKDLKWHEDILYSCGFGKCLIKHTRQPVVPNISNNI